MISFVISLALGMFPEVLFLTIFLSFAKNVKAKRIKLFLLLSVGYIGLIMIVRYQFIFYVAYIVYSYLVLKLLYKSHISDMFLCSLWLGYMTFISYSVYKLLGSNYYFAFVIDRILLFIPLLFKKYIRIGYLKYLSLWNRTDEKRPIKSITLRNISLILLNLIILVFNICALLCILDSIKYN